MILIADGLLTIQYGKVVLANLTEMQIETTTDVKKLVESLI